MDVMRAGDIGALDIYLMDNNPNRAINGSTLLIEAIKLDQADVVARLLEKGADPRQADRDGRTPYIFAQMRNNPRILLLLGGYVPPRGKPGHIEGQDEIPRWVHDGKGGWRRD